ncbi:hypothetical protein ACIBCA_02030 [Kitasatospora sp. NPDC051170]|uniref:hypothetical protein n=1 Tax=Kitasatospora sp. NPDC051170 TaxID=3364056 RepID=UPI0037AC2E79
MTNEIPMTGTTARPGPPHLLGLTEPAGRPGNVSESFWSKLLEVGWAGRLRSEDGRTRFQLHYYGQLFDGAVHGYDAMFCESWDEEREAFVDPDDPGLAVLADGRRIPFEVARHAAFDALSVVATNGRGRATDVVSEELA